MYSMYISTATSIYNLEFRSINLELGPKYTELFGSGELRNHEIISTKPI